MKNTSHLTSTLPGTTRGAAMIATIGTEVPVVTVTIDLLNQEQHLIFDEVVIIHTEPDKTDNSDTAKRLNAAMDRLSAEMADYMAEGVVKSWTKVRLERRNGKPLADIHTEQDEDILFATIDAQVQRQRHADRVVHLNASGGRKSMTLYAMSVAHLRFGERDRLWLLVSSDAFIASRATHLQNRLDAKLIRVPVIRPTNSFESVLIQRGQILNNPAIKPTHLEVLAQVAVSSSSNAEIAAKLYITPGAVEKRIENLIKILFKLFAEMNIEEEMQNRMDLIRLFAPYYQWRKIRGGDPSQASPPRG